MGIINSSASLIDYISGIGFSSIYVEDNFPLAVSGTFRMDAVNAVQYLLASAVVGNKAAGFFHCAPKIPSDRALRGVCIFVSLELPDEIEIPIFFCKKPEGLAEMLPRVLKVSIDTNMPVYVVISANILNNYMTKPFPKSDMDRISPYLHVNTFSAKRDIHSVQQKMLTVYSELRASMTQNKVSDRMAFELPKEDFPLYIFPLRIPEQRALFTGLKTIHTTEKDLPFFHRLIHILHDLDIDISPDLLPVPIDVKTALCPGCPFTAMYANLPLKDVIVFTSVRCAAVKNVYPVEQVSIMEYMGVLSRKVNLPTLFAGNLSETLSVKNLLIGNGTFILLNDCSEKAPFPYISHPSKLKTVKNMVFPYSCGNIKTYSRLKKSMKRCVCYKNDTDAGCVENSHCPAMMRGENDLRINFKLCTGCRSCVPYCDKRALS